MISKKKFAERLFYLRTSKNLTQHQLGIEVGTKKQSVNNWEKEVATPNLDMASDIADYFDVSLDYLVGRSDDPTRR